MNKHTTVAEFLAELSEDKKAQILKIRECILNTDSSIQEHIKWNAPSYVYNNEDCITFNIVNKEGLVKLVFHMGATRKENKAAPPILEDAHSIIDWVSDIRGYVTFKDMDDVNLKETALKQLIAEWVKLV